MHRTLFSFDTLKNWVKRAKGREAEGGQSIVVMVLGLVGLLAFAGLVFDGGTVYAQFRRMQNAADAGAMAGANELSKKNTPDGTTNGQVCATVLNYSHSLNAEVKYPDWQTDPTVQVQYIIPDLTLPEKYRLKAVPGCHVGVPNNPSGPPPDDAKGIRVTVSTTFKTFFLRLLGLGTGTSTAHASAEYGPATPLNVQPLAKRCPDTDPPCDLRIGLYQEIWQSSEPGNLGWLGFNGDTNVPTMLQEFDPNAPPVPYIDDMTMVDGVPRTPCKTIGIGCWVQGKPGVSNTLEGDIEGDWAGADKPPLIIVLYDRQVEGGANTEYHIVGFAAFKLDKLDMSGNELGEKSMWGTFVRWMDSAALCKDCADTGLYSVHLIPDIAEPPPAAGAKGKICVTVAYDVGVDGGFNAGEDYYLAGATVTIKDSGGATKASWNTLGLSTNCTDDIFDPGTYTVIETNPLGYVSDPNPPYANGADTQSAVVTAGGTADVLFLDYWSDTGNIVVYTRDDGGAVLPSLAAILKPASNPSWIVGGPTKSTTGTVYFRNRPPGNYIVAGVPPPGYDMVPAYDNVPVTVTVGTTATVTIKAKRYPVGKICVEVWDDEDTSGWVRNNPPDKSLWGSVITLGGTENRTHTMGDGEFTYCFENLRLGPYTVSQSHPPGYSSASLPPPASADSWAGSITTDGQQINLQFRDYIPPRGNLCVEVFDDVTGDGLATPGEVDIGGANILIYNMLDLNNPVATYTTNGTEPKCFSVLTGNYRVVETSNPPGYISTTPDTRDNIGIAKDMAVTVQFGDRAHANTATPTRTRTPTPTRTNTPPANTTPTRTPTPTMTPVPGAICVTVYEDLNGNGMWDILPSPTPTGTLTITPEPYLAPKSVSVSNSSNVQVGTWDGTGGQPHCFNNLWPDSYGVTETDPPGYASTTGNNVTVVVSSLVSSPAEYGDKLCFAAPPFMRDPIFQSGQQWMLQWDNLPGTFYTIYASDNSIDPAVPTWTVIGELTGVNYLVERNQGTYFYVTATDNCGTSGPSNVVSIGGP